MGFTYKILYQIKVRKTLYQQDRVLLSEVMFFFLIMRKQHKRRGNYSPCF